MISSTTLDALLNSPERCTPAWWAQVQAWGTPLVAPAEGAADGMRRVVFVWRDPRGVPPADARRQVFIEVHSHTPHPLDALTALQPWPGTDGWYWETRLPADWCGSYVLVPVGEGALPLPQVPAQRRSWWRARLVADACADPLNPWPPHGNGWGQPLSALRLGQPVQPVPPLQGSLRSWRWMSPRLGNRRRVWLYTPPAPACTPEGPRPLVILLDGQAWVGAPTALPLLADLDVLTTAGTLAPACYLCIDSLSPGARSHELGCEPAFWEAVQAELLPRVAQLATLQPGRCWLVGQSLGGLAAVYGALHWPRVFCGALAQSGAFWWPDVDGGPGSAWLTRQLSAGLLPPAGQQWLIQVGRHDLPDMRQGSQQLARALVAQGHACQADVFAGGHDWLCWHQALVAGLPRLLPAVQTLAHA
jgi:enterochelin esterase family protein